MMNKLNEFCCICFTTDKSFKRLFDFDNDGVTHYHKLTLSISEMVDEDMNEQRFLCAKCCENVNNVYNFRQKCLSSKQNLKEYLSQLQTVSKTNQVVGKRAASKRNSKNSEDLASSVNIKEEYLSDGEEFNTHFMKESVPDVSVNVNRNCAFNIEHIEIPVKVEYQENDQEEDNYPLEETEKMSDSESISSGDYSESASENESEAKSEGWKLQQSYEAPTRFPFTGNPGCKFPGENLDELGFFELFFDGYLMNMIMDETTRNASSSSKRNFEPVSLDEMFIFIAINILQGIAMQPSERVYWSASEIFHTSIFSKLMSQRRYFEIKSNLRFSDNISTHPDPEISKIWPVYDYLNRKFSKLYTPERDITVNESFLFRDKLRQARLGIKLLFLSEATSGYVYSSIIYTDKHKNLERKFTGMSGFTQLTLTLMESLLDKGYCVITDHSSVQLADYLVGRKTDIYGALKQTKKGAPKELRIIKLKKGEVLAYRKGKISVMKLMGRSEINFLSSVHNVEEVEIKKKNRIGKLVKKLKIIVDYNATKGIVDQLHNLHDNPMIRKRDKINHKKIFFHYLDLCVWNSFVLYRKNGGPNDHFEFRKNLIEKIIDKHRSVRKNERPGVQVSPLRLVERHFPEFIPPTKKIAPCRLCAVCSSERDAKGKKRRKETRYFCRVCNVGLCAVPCFMTYHTKLVF